MKRILILVSLLISVVAWQSHKGRVSHGAVKQRDILLDREFADALPKGDGFALKRTLTNGYSDMVTSSSKSEQAQATPTPCPWQQVIHPNEIRFPINMDTHAAYAIYSFPADGTIALNVEGSFPYAAFLSFTTYNAKGLLFDALLDKDIAANSGSVNPFQAGALVNAPNRSYRITVLPYGQTPSPNSISMPPLPTGSTSMTVVLVLRIYLPEPGLDRLGGVPLPTITAVSAKDLQTGMPCPTPSQSPQASALPDSETPAFGTFNGVPQPPAPKLGKILFYRPPVSLVPFADGSGQLTADDCTTYLMATLNADKIAVIRFKRIPTFFNNADTNAGTTFRETQVRYLSLGSYGASVIPPLGSGLLGNIAWTQIRRTSDGGATFVVIPDSLPKSTKDLIEKMARARSFNVLPMAKLGLAVKPFLIYRNKVAATGFEGSISKVPCYTGTSFDKAPEDYAASPCNMGLYAPQGVECSVNNFLLGKCRL